MPQEGLTELWISRINDYRASGERVATWCERLLEAGVNPRVVQRYMGHSKLETTMVYLHLTRKGTEDACQIINQTMSGFQSLRPRIQRPLWR